MFMQATRAEALQAMRARIPRFTDFDTPQQQTLAVRAREERGRFGVHSAARHRLWTRFSNGALCEERSPRIVFERAKERGAIVLGEPERVIHTYYRTRAITFYEEDGVVGKTFAWDYGDGETGLQIAREMAARDAPVPVFGWRKGMLVDDCLLELRDGEVSPKQTRVVEVLSRKMEGEHLQYLDSRDAEALARFKQIGFIDGSFHRKGIHVGNGESNDKLGNYIFDGRDGKRLWYVDIEPIYGATQISRTVSEPLPFEQRIKLLKDHILAIGCRMNDSCLRAYVAGYARGFLGVERREDEKIARIARALYKILKPEMEKSESVRSIPYLASRC